MKDKKEGMKAYYGITFLIGLGFFTMGLMDPLYDTYVPIFLKNFLSRDGLVGSLMGLDNLFAILLIPVFSALSDRTRTAIGRRMPYIIICLPLTAIFFALLPSAALKSLGFLIILIFLLNLVKQAARGPVVALMPDIIPGEYRSEANGIINTMGGIAAIVGTVGLAKLYDVNISLPIIGKTIKEFPHLLEGRNATYIGSLPFLIAAVLVVLATLLLFLFVKEKKQPLESEEEKKVPIIKSIKYIFTSGDKSVLLILISLLLWFIGYQGVLPWIGLYGVNSLGLSPGTAGLSAGMVGIAYAVFAIPSGILAHKIGRKKVIRFALMGVAIIVTLLFLHQPLMTMLGITGMAAVAIFWGLLFVFGIFWGSIVTNSFPMLWQMASYTTMGIYTGLYYFFSQMAGVIAPILTGGLRDAFGPRVVFLVSAIFMVAAFFTMSGVTRGEPGEEPADHSETKI
ncbi:MAG: MFS transporter [Spirochaetales bacterium]|nr:MFS transporter [Spirochaetales bacterium]